jgi:hypothetical protein
MMVQQPLRPQQQPMVPQQQPMVPQQQPMLPQQQPMLPQQQPMVPQQQPMLPQQQPMVPQQQPMVPQQMGGLIFNIISEPSPPPTPEELSPNNSPLLNNLPIPNNLNAPIQNNPLLPGFGLPIGGVTFNLTPNTFTAGLKPNEPTIKIVSEHYRIKVPPYSYSSFTLNPFSSGVSL